MKIRNGILYEDAKHFSQVDSSTLIDRISRLDYHSSSSFNESEDVDSIVAEMLSDEGIQEALSDWTGNGILVLNKNFNRIIGFGYCRDYWHEWNAGPALSDTVEILVRKTDEEYAEIISVYPVINQDIYKKNQNRCL